MKCAWACKYVDTHSNVGHKTCAAGEWTSTVGTASADTQCTRCPPGTARPKAPASNTVLEAPSSCPSCVAASLYSDNSGLRQCKQCPAGHFGVIESGSKAEGGHKACDDDTCELPTALPANSMLVNSQCPQHGKHVSKNGADTCLLSCKPGFYSSSTKTPFKCAPDGKSTKASYQGGAITCTGLHLARWMCFGDRAVVIFNV